VEVLVLFTESRTDLARLLDFEDEDWVTLSIFSPPELRLLIDFPLTRCFVGTLSSENS